MPGLSQLKKFKEDILSLGDELTLRSIRGERPVNFEIPKSVPKEEIQKIIENFLAEQEELEAKNRDWLPKPTFEVSPIEFFEGRFYKYAVVNDYDKTRDSFKRDYYAYDFLNTESRDSEDQTRFVAVKFKDIFNTKFSKAYLELKSKIKEMESNYEAYLNTCLIDCNSCGSKITAAYIKNNTCPVCKQEIASQGESQQTCEIKKLKKELESLEWREMQKKAPIKWMIKIRYKR